MKNINKKRNFIVYFAYLGDLEELILDPDLQIKDLLNNDFILLFVDPLHFRVWLWNGHNIETYMKFISVKMALSIREKLGIGFKITALNQDNETPDFLAMIELVEETIDIDPLLKTLSREILLPEGFKRKIVITKNIIYKIENDKNGL